MIDITREELRADILEITTVVVDNAVRGVRKMATEGVLALSGDISALSQQIDRMDKRLTRGIRRTNASLESHIADTSAHTRPILS